MFPCEIILHIAGFLKNPKDVRNLSLTNKENYIFITKNIILKEKWFKYRLDLGKESIKQLCELGFRYIKFNNKIQIIYNINQYSEYIQIMTSSGIISTFKSLDFTEKNIIHILVEAPYICKKKPLKI